MTTHTRLAHTSLLGKKAGAFCATRLLRCVIVNKQFEDEWCTNLLGLLTMLDQLIRLYGDDEELLKRMAGDFMWRVTQANLSYETQPDWSDVGTFVKFAGEPGISHLVAEFRRLPLPTDADV